MSKIYEALQRAEQERVTTEVQRGHAVGHSTSAMAGETVEVPTSASLMPASLSTIPFPQVLTQNHVWYPRLVTLPALADRGAAVEQFRSLRSHLFEFRDLNELKTLMVSSGLPEEGKSYIAANLAISLARHKASRVLLIDGDMRRSSLHKLLGCPSEPGLTEYLADKATLEQVLQQGRTVEGTLLSPGLSTLTFLPAGQAGDSAADLSGSKRFRELIEGVAALFDWIVIDSSPVNLVTDGVNLARACDGVLLVARGGVTRYLTLRRAVTELKASKILGVVLNAVENPPAADGYYGYDAYEKKD